MPYKDIIELVFVPRTEAGDTKHIDQLDKSLQNVEKTGKTAHRSLMELGMTTWYLSIAAQQITNSMKMFAQGNEMATAKVNLLQTSVGSMTYGFYAMTNLARMTLSTMTGEVTKFGSALHITSAMVPALSLGFGVLIAVITGIIPVIAQWNRAMEEAYANVTKLGASAKNLFEQYFKASNIFETANALQQVRKQLGEDFVNILKASASASDAFANSQDILIKKMIEAWKNTKEGKDALEAVREEMKQTGIGVQPVVVTLERAGQQFSYVNQYIYDETVLLEKLIEQWKTYNDLPSQTKEDENAPYKALIARGKELENYYNNLNKKNEEVYEKWRQAYLDYLADMAKLRGDETAQFELELQRQIETYEKAGLSRKLIDEYVALKKQKFEEEQTAKIIQEIFKREQAEWDAIMKEREAREKAEAEKENIRNSFLNKYKSYLYNELELTQKTLTEEVEAYLKAGGDIQTAKEIIEKMITQIVLRETENRIREIEKERDVAIQNLEKERDIRLNLYQEILELNYTQTENEIMNILLQYNKYAETVKDEVLLETWKKKELQAIWQELWDTYNKQVEEAKERRLRSEEEITDKINRMKLSNIDYEIMLLQKEIDEYYNAGVSIEKIQEYSSLRIQEIKQQETEAWIREEERKLKAIERFQYSYEMYIMEAEGRKDEMALLRETRNVTDLIKDAIETYGEGAWEYINTIVSKFPDYIKNVLPDITFTDEQIKQAQEQLSKVAETVFGLKPPDINIQVEIPDETKNVISSIQKPPDWSGFLEQVKQIANEVQVVNVLVEDWYKSELEIINNVYNTLIEQEKQKARAVIEAIVNEIISKNWYEIGLSSGSGFGEGFYTGASGWVKMLALEVAKYFEFHSPPEEGPLRDTEQWGAGFLIEFLKGMLSQQNLLQNYILRLFLPVDFYRYFKVVLQQSFDEIPKWDEVHKRVSWFYPFEKREKAWYSNAEYWEDIFKGVEELLEGKEIYKTEHYYKVPLKLLKEYGYLLGRKNLASSEYADIFMDLWSDINSLSYMIDIYKTGSNRVTQEDLADKVRRMNEKYKLNATTWEEALAKAKFLGNEMDDYGRLNFLFKKTFISKKYGLLQEEFPNFSGLIQYWSQMLEENPELEKLRASKIYDILSGKPIPSQKLYQALKGNKLEAKYLAIPGLDVVMELQKSGWQDWMKVLAEPRYFEPRYWNYFNITQLRRMYGDFIQPFPDASHLKKYEILDVLGAVYENVPKEKGTEFFINYLQEAMKWQKYYQEAVERDMKENEYHYADTSIKRNLEEATNRIKYGFYFLMEKYNLEWEDITKAIGEEKLKELYPELGKIFLQPDYSGRTGEISGGGIGNGITINLNFNIESINDVNINDFVSLVAEKMIEQLAKYIIL